MSVDFTKLQEIGLEKIAEETHVSKQHLQSLVQENFKALNKVQFLGFISILERDYSIDLGELKERGLKFYGDDAAMKPSSVFIEKKSKKSSKGIYILVALVVFILAIYYNLGSDKTAVEVNAAQVQTVTQEIEALVENNTSDENNSAFESNESVQLEEDSGLNTAIETDEMPVATSEKEIENNINTLKIVANKKLWFGYIELDTENKTQKVFSGDLDLDAKKNWLLLFGHNNIEISLNGEIQKFEKSKNVQFLYKDGVLTQISLEEFKKLNKGQKW